MKKIAWLLLPLAVLLAMLLGQAPRGVAQRIDRAEDNPKIDRWVIDHTTTDNRQAEFLVILNDHADLAAADRLTTKAAKGRYVYETLYATAQRSQQSIIAWLQQRGVALSIVLHCQRDLGEGRSGNRAGAGRPIGCGAPRRQSRSSTTTSRNRLTRSARCRLDRTSSRAGHSIRECAARVEPGFHGAGHRRRRAGHRLSVGSRGLASRIIVAGMALRSRTTTTGTTAFIRQRTAVPAASIRPCRATITGMARTPWARSSATMAERTRSAWRPARSGSAAATWTTAGDHPPRTSNALNSSSRRIRWAAHPRRAIRAKRRMSPTTRGVVRQSKGVTRSAAGSDASAAGGRHLDGRLGHQ